MPARDEKGRFIKPGAGTEAAKETAKASEGASKGTSAFSKMAGAAKALGGAMGSKVLGATKALTPAIKSLGSVATSLASDSIPNAQQAMTAFGNALGGAVTEGTKKLATALKGLGPEGAAAGAAIEILGAAVGATIGTISTLMGLAIEVTQKIDLMRDRFAALAGSASGGKAVQASIAKLSATLPFASSQVSTWAQSLLAAGLEGKKLEEAIKGVAAAQALMGEQGGAAAEKLIKTLAEGGAGAQKMIKAMQAGGPKANKLLADMGLRVEDVAAAMGMSVEQFQKAKIGADAMNAAVTKALQKKGAGPLADMMLTFPAILQKAREGFLSLFAKLGPSVKPFMKAIKELFGNFNKGAGGMKGLQKVVTEVFGTIFKYATMAVKAVGAFVKENFTAKSVGAIWKGIKAYFAAFVMLMKPAIALFKALWNNAFLMNGIKTIFKVIGAAILIVIGLIGFAAAAFANIVGVIAGVLGAVTGIVGGIVGAFAEFTAAAWSAGADFISGLIGGITGGAGAVIDAVKNLASSALGAFKSALGIASPSKVMARMGGFAAEGTAQGLDQGAGKVEAAGARVGEAAAGGTAQGMAGGGGGAKGKGGVSVTIESGAVVIHAGGATITDEGLAAALERLLMAQGLGAR